MLGIILSVLLFQVPNLSAQAEVSTNNTFYTSDISSTRPEHGMLRNIIEISIILWILSRRNELVF